MNKIKVGICVAYDWEMLRFSIPPIYDYADVICLSIDINRQSWSGGKFDWDEVGFRKVLAELDHHNKIKVYEDQFYIPSLRPIENDTRQRNKMADYLGKEDGWHLQIDSDEYFLNFRGFVEFLKGFKSKRKVNICCPMLNLYKQLPEGLLWVKPSKFSEIVFFPIATRFPSYESGRVNGYFNILTDFSILHQSWARSEKEIWEKINNWGHSNEFDISKFFSLWKDVNSKNYMAYKNFHFLTGESWPALGLQEKAKDILDALQLEKNDFPLPITKLNLEKANSIWVSRFKKVLKYV